MFSIHLKVLMLIILIFSSVLIAKDVQKVQIVRSVDMKDQVLFSIPVNSSDYSITTKDVWRSSNGIKCIVKLFKAEKGKAGVNFECNTREGYKAQVSVDCTKNTNRENSMYLFFGSVGKAEDFGNFYIWCE